jgi:DNA repair protein RecO (recombination protein O)
VFHSTRGIVFHQTKYSETSLVVKILTEEAGLGSFIIKGARGPKAKIRASLFQPLTLLEMVVSRNEKSELHFIKEARVAYPYKTIPDDIRKSSILLFLNELLYKSIQEEAVNPELFRFIFDHLVLLDQTTENPANLHLLFAIRLTRYLGFFPHGKYLGESSVFDMTEGHFSQVEPLPADHFITGSTCVWFSKLLEISPELFYSVHIPSAVRSEMMEKILGYYLLHLPIPGKFKSHLVLHEILQK